MSLTPDITPEQIDDWFRIGKKALKVEGVAKPTTKGRIYDPNTRQPRVQPTQHVPHYKSHPQFHGGHDYAIQYQKEEEERLMNKVAWAASETTSMLSSHLDTLEIDSTIAGTDTTIPAEFVPANATDVYNNYSFASKYDEKLPILEFRDKVLSTIDNYSVTVVQGATGSGKTTQVAQYILDHHAQQNKYCNIVVTQPRRIAAISIARRVCAERDWELGTICGYQVGLDKVASEDTRILYCTTGILLNKLINEKNMNQFTHVLLDEVHERDQETDFCLLVVKRLLRTNSRTTRVVLMSATFDTDMFAQYFSLPVLDKLEQAPVVNVEGRPYKVLQFYAEDLMQLGDIPNLEEHNPCISQEATNLAVKLIEQFDSLEEKEQGLSPNGFAPVRGTVLVFLPGLGEIQDFVAELNRLSVKHRLKLIPLHSSITTEEQAEVFHSPQPGWRKVILSTNIAESSITVPDIKYVIDFCLTKNLTCDFETNYTSLQVNWASKANCRQREGRAGRVSNGRVYRLVTRLFYEKYIPDYGIPEMQRSPLDKLILQVKVLDLGEPKAILAHALSPPNIDDIERNILLLKEIGALISPPDGVITNKHDGHLTFIGRVLADLPVDCKIGKLILFGHVFGLLEECLIIAAAMSVKSIFAKPFKQGLESYRNKLAWSSGSLSDSLAILQAYQTWQSKLNRGEFKRRGGGGEVGWGKQRYLQIRRLKEVSLLVTDLEKRLVKFNILKPKYEPHYRREISPDQHNLLLKVVLCGAFYPNYFVRGEIDEMDSLKQLSGKNPLNTVMVKGLPANHGRLYKEVIEDMFRKCETNPKAYFEETKAYVEFPWKPYMKSKVHQGVYMALKMKQLRMPLYLDLYSDEEAFNMLQRLDTARAEASQEGQLRSNRLTGTSGIVPEARGQQVGVHVAPPDPTKDLFKVCVTDVIECSHFWAQYSDGEHIQQLLAVQNELNRSPQNMLRPLSGHARVGQYYAAPYQDSETIEYYRAKVQACENRYEESMRAHREFVEIFFVDYGNVGVMPAEQLRELPPHLLNIPFQALECKLIKIRPSTIKCPDGKWTNEATEQFKRIVLNQELHAMPYSVVHGVVRMELIFVTPEGRQFYIGEELKGLCFADVTQESGLSEQNHEFRQLEYSKARNQRPLTKNYLGEERGAKGFMPVNLGAEGLSRTRNQGGKVNLTGPSNPYEMSFYSLTNVGRLRAAKIDPDSVNCVAIDDEPYDPHQRLMVAGFVGLNPNGTTMISRDTTILPLTPGLAAIVVLLFTPKAEFRTDSQKTKYIGALCGLGADPETGYSLLPDHDMEVPFDVKFTTEDISKINGVRLAINMAIGSQSVIATWSDNAVYKIQKNARKKLMELIQTRRESCSVESPEHVYQWNQVDSDDILSPKFEDYGDQAIYALHSGVSLLGEVLPSDANQEHERLRGHVMMLRDIVRRNEKRQPTKCELCNVTCPTNQLLALHLETKKHKELEQEVMSKSSN